MNQELTQEAAAFNLQLEEKTQEIVAKALLNLFNDPAFVNQLLQSYTFMNRLTTRINSDYDFQSSVRQMIANKLQGN